MRHVDDLRHALAGETADLRIEVSTELVRRRARRVRSRRAALVAVGLVLALAIPAGVLAAGAYRPDHDTARPGPVCVTPPHAGGTVGWLGEPTRLAIDDQYDSTGRHQVFVGLTGTRDTPVLTVVFRYEATGVEQYAHTTVLRRTPDGGFTSWDETGAGRRLMGVRLNFGPSDVVDLGMYAGRAEKIVVSTDRATTVSGTVHNEQTGWTLFWARHDPWSPLTAEGAGVRLDAYETGGTLLASAPGTAGAGIRAEPARYVGTPGPSCTDID